MPWPVTINGKTYTLADFAPYTYATSFPNILQDVADVAQAAVDAAGASGVPAVEATVASAATTNIGAVTNYRVAITGTNTITSFGGSTSRTKLLRFTDSLTLVHNATNLILLGGANIITQAGDMAVASSDSSGNWRLRDYFRASGEPLVSRGGYRNRLINGDFRINQDGSSSASTSYSAGTYVRDGWKAAANGVTVSFSTEANGDVTANITAGSLLQIVEGGLYMPDGGAYTLSWLGTAQARFYQGSAPAYRSGPIVIAIGSNTNTTVEFGVGSVRLPQFEFGLVATPFERRDDELFRCQRYFATTYPPGIAPGTPGAATPFLKVVEAAANYPSFPTLIFPRLMRTTPGVVFYSPVTGASGVIRNITAAPNVDVPASNFGNVTPLGTAIQVNNTNITAGHTLTAHITASARM